MNVSMLRPRDRVHAVINLNSEDFYWMRRPDDKADDELVAVEALFYHEDSRDSVVYILDGGEYGVFAVPATQIFKTRDEAKAYIREQERERACQMLNETATLHGMLRFLASNDAIKIPADPVAREVLYVHLEDAGLGDRIPLYALADA